MDYTLPIARRTRSKHAEIYRGLFEKKKKKKKIKEEEAEAIGTVGEFIGSSEKTTGFEDCEPVEDPYFDVAEKISGGVGRGTNEDPFCIDEDDDKEDVYDNEEEMESSSNDEDVSDETYDVERDRESRFCRKRRTGSGSESEIEVSDDNGEKKKKKKEKERETSEGKENLSGDDSVSSSGREETQVSEEGEEDESGQRFDFVAKKGNSGSYSRRGKGKIEVRTHSQHVNIDHDDNLGSSLRHGKAKTRLGTESQPFYIDYEDIDDDEDAEAEEPEEASGSNGKKLGKKKDSKERRKSKRGSRGHDGYQILLDSIFGHRSDEDSILGDNATPEEDGNHPTAEIVLPLKFTFGVEQPNSPAESDFELEIEKLWKDLDLALASCDIGSIPTDVEVENEASCSSESDANLDTLCRKGKHHLILDEQIGLVCAYCSYVKVEIKHIVPSFERNPLGRSDLRDLSTFDWSIFNELSNQDADIDSHTGSGFHPRTGTVWDHIRGVKNSMYPHQREGFEFIWNKIAGGIHLEDLNKRKNSSGGEGCIISHAPGTGKTRLTIVFLQSYLKQYPKCLPIIIAPRSMLLTWEEEFRKWKVNFPFHNLNMHESSGKEDQVADNCLKMAGGCHDQDTLRLLKLFSWTKGGSILGITYRLFEKLVSEQKSSKGEQVRKILLDFPGLVVLDEGHTPRNKKSLIWQALSKVKTEKRILLSGTPFQNNFDELYNTLLLVRPSFEKSFKQWYSLTKSIGQIAEDEMDDERVKELKLIIDSVAHIHRGSVLESLPGLRDSVVLLKPSLLQERLLQRIQIERKENQMERNQYLEFEHAESMISVHPTLSLKTTMMEYGRLNPVERDKLERHRLNPDVGVKAKFLLELVRLSVAMDEKVLVFSQFIPPLTLVMEQLKAQFKWSERVEISCMHGKCSEKKRQSMINAFNDPSSKVRVLLASTRACAEGINLVGASRVVLLDVVWNPSVEMQAISRAFRLGQKKAVFVYHLITSGTMEGKKYSRQVEKDRLSKLVFSCSENQPKTLFRVSEDRILEEMVQHEKLKHMFEKISFKQKEPNLG